MVWSSLSWTLTSFSLNFTTDRKTSPEGHLYSRWLSSLLVERIPQCLWLVGVLSRWDLLKCYDAVKSNKLWGKKLYLDIIYVNVAKPYLRDTWEFFSALISVDEGNSKAHKCNYSHSDIYVIFIISCFN